MNKFHGCFKMNEIQNWFNADDAKYFKENI